MPTKVIMPQLGESVVEGTVSKWLKQVGETVSEFEPLLEVSTDKVDTEVPAPAKGVLLQIYVAEGETVERGSLLAMIGQPGEAVPDAPATVGESVIETSRADQSRQPQIQASANGETQHSQHSQQNQQSQRFSPVVARMAAEHSIDLTQIQGSGMGGRVTKKDVEAYLAGDKEKIREAAPQIEEIPPWEQPVTGDLFKPTSEIFEKVRQQAQPAQVTPVPQDQAGTLVPLNAMRRMIAEHMVRSKLQTAPHVTTVFEVDMSRVMAHWNANMEPFARQGVKLTLTAYFVAAIVQAVQAKPMLNSQWTENGIFIHNNINVGMAVALEDGLIVPVIKNAQDVSLSGLAKQVSDLAARGRSKSLRPDEVTGGTITLTNHGVSGSLFATPIINQPQSAIVGVGAVQKRVVVISDNDSDAIAIRPMMYATLTFDHRVADGAQADGFLAAFKKSLEQWG
jgi:pyruvate/2-oxoglutarate dehydrogenase complex dihydrolipoamide acyltransferase (E2) component